MKSSNSKRITIRVLIIFGILIVMIYFSTRKYWLGNYKLIKNENRDVEFSSEGWKKEVDTERYKMVNDLQKSISLIGMSDVEIDDLLGKRSLLYDPDNDVTNENYYWGYTIRYDSFEGDEVLLIRFKDNKGISIEKEYLCYL